MYNSRLHIALGNAQTIIPFRVSRADAEVLSRILGKVNTEQIKHNKQVDVQHPLYSPLYEQWEGFIQHLTNQKVHQFTVKTADDRFSSIWSLKMKTPKISYSSLEETIWKLLRTQGNDYQDLQGELLRIDRGFVSQPYYAY